MIYLKDNAVSTIQCFDFENLFTNIEIKLLLDVLIKILDENNIDKELNLDRAFFVKLAKFCLNNNYIQFGNTLYSQQCGIGMGTNYSSTAANLFLFYFEELYCRVNSCYISAFRYIDDIIVFNFNFEEIFKDIYPSCLNLNRTNNNDATCNFLDIHIDLVKDSVSLYDKRNDFHFDFISLPHWFSSIHKKIYINIIISQCARFKKICNNRTLFEKTIYLFIAKLFYKNFYPIDFVNYYVNSYLKSTDHF